MASIGNKHLNFGGSIGPKSGRLGPRPAQGTSFRSQKRFETIIRLENAGFPDQAIASMLLISKNRLQQTKKDPAYIAARVRLTHGIILDSERQLAQIKEQRREILTQMLPPALQAIADELQRPANTIAERKLRSVIALELMDREGTFAKVSRTEIKPVDSFDFEKHDTESMGIINTLRGLVSPPPPPKACGSSSTADVSSISTADAKAEAIDAAIETNVAFANSHTLSAVDQQAALDKLEEEAAALGVLETMPLPSVKIN